LKLESGELRDQLFNTVCQSSQPISWASSWCSKSAFESVWMLNVKSVSGRSGFQLAPSHL